MTAAIKYKYKYKYKYNYNYNYNYNYKYKYWSPGHHRLHQQGSRSPPEHQHQLQLQAMPEYLQPVQSCSCWRGGQVQELSWLNSS